MATGTANVGRTGVQVGGADPMLVQKIQQDKQRSHESAQQSKALGAQKTQQTSQQTHESQMQQESLGSQEDRDTQQQNFQRELAADKLHEQKLDRESRTKYHQENREFQKELQQRRWDRQEDIAMRTIEEQNLRDVKNRKFNARMAQRAAEKDVEAIDLMMAQLKKTEGNSVATEKLHQMTEQINNTYDRTQAELNLYTQGSERRLDPFNQGPATMETIGSENSYLTHQYWKSQGGEVSSPIVVVLQDALRTADGGTLVSMEELLKNPNKAISELADSGNLRKSNISRLLKGIDTLTKFYEDRGYKEDAAKTQMKGMLDSLRSAHDLLNSKRYDNDNVEDAKLYEQAWNEYSGGGIGAAMSAARKAFTTEIEGLGGSILDLLEQQKQGILDAPAELYPEVDPVPYIPPSYSPGEEEGTPASLEGSADIGELDENYDESKREIRSMWGNKAEGRRALRQLERTYNKTKRSLGIRR